MTADDLFQLAKIIAILILVWYAVSIPTCWMKAYFDAKKQRTSQRDGHDNQ